MKVILNQTLKNRDVSQYRLAQDTGIATSTINNLCNNKTTRIDFSVLDKICAYLNCDISDILHYDPNEPKTEKTILKRDLIMLGQKSFFENE